jgi:hypothetical protein
MPGGSVWNPEKNKKNDNNFHKMENIVELNNIQLIQ